MPQKKKKKAGYSVKIGGGEWGVEVLVFHCFMLA